MAPQEQADLWMALRDRMKVNWAELTLQEKKAGGYFSLFLLFLLGDLNGFLLRCRNVFGGHGGRC